MHAHTKEEAMNGVGKHVGEGRGGINDMKDFL